MERRRRKERLESYNQAKCNTNLDPDPEWWSGRLKCNSNYKGTTLQPPHITLSVTLIRASF